MNQTSRGARSTAALEAVCSVERKQTNGGGLDGGGTARRGTSKPTVAPVPRLALNIEQACAALGVSWDVWREHVEPDVRLVRVGARKLVPVAELERWLAEHAEATLERR